MSDAAEHSTTLRHPEPPDRRPAQRIGPYRLVRRLGRGGMGTVYLGLGNPKAPNLGDFAGALEQFGQATAIGLRPARDRAGQHGQPCGGARESHRAIEGTDVDSLDAAQAELGRIRRELREEMR